MPDAIEVSPTITGIAPTPEAPAADDASPLSAGEAAPSSQPAEAPAAEAAPAAPAAASAGPATSPDPVTIPLRELVLVTGTGVHRFTIEIADDPVERARGLMFRTEMAADHGMLFDFGAEGPRSFWMRNTPLPLDIIFVAADGTVVSIARNTTPYSEASIPSEGDARFVFEVNAGIADRIGLAPGDTLLHRRVER